MSKCGVFRDGVVEWASGIRTQDQIHGVRVLIRY
jgi:hypothetical protein